MVRGIAVSRVDVSRIMCIATVAFAAQACSSPTDEPTHDPSFEHVTQAVVGACGNTNICIARAACDPWDLHMQGDGFGYAVAAPWIEDWASSFSYSCADGLGCDDWDQVNTCPGAATDRKNALIATRPGISQPALNGFTVTGEAFNYEYRESADCQNPWSQSCERIWEYGCSNYINNYPTPTNLAHDWCPCIEYAPASCLAPTAVTAGNAHTCAVVGNGAQCWGSNSAGQLGNDSTVGQSFQRVAVTGLTSGVATITAGGSHTCAIVNGGVKCWGDNSHGQLGSDLPNNATHSRVPVSVPNLSSVQAIAGGTSHTCAVVLGAAKCWGSNDFGELGDSSTVERHAPVNVSNLGSGVQALTAGGQHSCAIVNGAARCWGYNGNGQLGTVTQIPDSSTQPVQVNGLASGVTAIAAGLSHTCAIVNGGLTCWGSNAAGQLGNGSTAPVPVGTLVAVPGLTSGVTGIVAGRNHTCAIVVAGAVKCWGANGSGQLGTGNDAPSASPVLLPDLPGGVRAIASGGDHSCAIADGSLKCWGANDNGQLAQNPDNGTRSNTPLVIGGLVCGLVNGVVQCFPATGCQDGSIEQTFGGGMVGCAGTAFFPNRGMSCAPGYQPASATQWMANHGVTAPTHHYWINDVLNDERLNMNVTGGGCFVSTTVGARCPTISPIMVCKGFGTDPEGNACGRGNCGFRTVTPNQFFGGCTGIDFTAGTLCVPVSVL